jgi:hypothetical protein
MARCCPKRTGRVSPLCAGSSDLNFPGNGQTSSLLAQFRSDGMSGFPLVDHSAIDGHVLQADHIATAQLAVDG